MKLLTKQEQVLVIFDTLLYEIAKILTFYEFKETFTILKFTNDWIVLKLSSEPLSQTIPFYEDTVTLIRQDNKALKCLQACFVALSTQIEPKIEQQLAFVETFLRERIGRQYEYEVVV